MKTHKLISKTPGGIYVESGNVVGVINEFIKTGPLPIVADAIDSGALEGTVSRIEYP